MGATTEENLQAIIDGQSGLVRYERCWDLPEPFCASRFSTAQLKNLQTEGIPFVESLAIECIRGALQDTTFDYGGDDVVFILSTTKGDVASLGFQASAEACYLGNTARRIADAVGFTTEPVVVCNACISGVSAIHLARLLLDSKCYRYAVVCGVEEQSAFTVSGFQALKAVSQEPCRPFDIERIGLNPGDAVATIILTDEDAEEATREFWHINRTSVHNDAYHLTSPSKTADGAFMALSDVMEGRDSDALAFINLHGTATMFNDQMEAVALKRAGLETVPVNGLKGYFGHTMGAAGVLETVLSMASADRGVVLGTRGFQELGVSVRLNISPAHRPTSKSAFVKMISGFGGGNAALLASKGVLQEKLMSERNHSETKGGGWSVTHSVLLTQNKVEVDGVALDVNGASGTSLLTLLYKTYVGDYPKYYKMDLLSRLGFIASELLLNTEGVERFTPRTDRAVLLFNRSGSATTDMDYLDTISDTDNFFPSPSLFIYTLPNIVAGEIAIRNHYQGETSFFVLPERNPEQIHQIVTASFCGLPISSAVYGWVDASGPSDFCAELFLGSRS